MADVMCLGRTHWRVEHAYEPSETAPHGMEKVMEVTAYSLYKSKNPLVFRYHQINTTETPSYIFTWNSQQSSVTSYHPLKSNLYKDTKTNHSISSPHTNQQHHQTSQNGLQHLLSQARRRHPLGRGTRPQSQHCTIRTHQREHTRSPISQRAGIRPAQPIKKRPR